MLTVNTYVMGAEPRLMATFVDSVTGLPMDPTGVTFVITEPTDPVTVTTYVYGTDAQLERESEGVYFVDWPTTVEGEHCYSFTGTGVVRGKAKRQFDVEADCA